MKRLPSCLSRRLDILSAVVNEQHLLATESNRSLNLGEEFNVGFLGAKERRIEDAVHVFGQA
jgi:hypothetical protein